MKHSNFRENKAFRCCAPPSMPSGSSLITLKRKGWEDRQQQAIMQVKNNYDWYWDIVVTQGSNLLFEALI
jgi:hypothetical protein